MKVLITGSNGFIGSHLAKFLADQNQNVQCMVRKTSNLDLLRLLNPSMKNIRLVYGDISDQVRLEEIFPDIDIIIHLAGAIRGIDQASFDRINVEGTRNVLEACKKVNPSIKRIVISSSMAAAGCSDFGGLREESEPPAPLEGDLYGISKCKAEFLAKKYMKDLPISMVRPPSVFGPGDTVSLDLFKTVKSNLKLYFSGPSRHHSIVEVTDLCQGIWDCALNPNAIGEIFYFACNGTAAWQDLHEIIAAKVFGKKYGTLIPIVLPAVVLKLLGTIMELFGKLTKKAPFINRTKATEALGIAWGMSTKKAKNLLGWQPKYSIVTALENAGKWYKDHNWL
jgi:nucleoside-diphosphate-sugar epimerase